MDVVPIYESALIVFNLASGLMLFNEIRFYDAKLLMALFCGSSLCIIGVVFIATKHQK